VTVTVLRNQITSFLQVTNYSIHKRSIHKAYQECKPCENQGVYHKCLSQVIRGQMRMNMTLTQYMHWHMLHEWYTTIFVPDVSQNEINSCLFPTYRPGTNFQTSCQCVKHYFTSQSRGFLEASQHLGLSKDMES